MAQLLQMDTDLVLAPRFQFEVHQAVCAVGAHLLVVRDSPLAAARVLRVRQREIGFVVL